MDVVLVVVVVGTGGMGGGGGRVVGSTSMAAGVLAVGAAAAAGIVGAGRVGAAWLASPPPSSSEEVGDGGTMSRTERRRGGEPGGAAGVPLSSVSMLIAAVVGGWGRALVLFASNAVGGEEGKESCRQLRRLPCPCVHVLCCALCVSLSVCGLDVECGRECAFSLRRAASSFPSQPSCDTATLRLTLTHLQCQTQDRLVVEVVHFLAVMASHSSTKLAATQKVRLTTRGRGVGRSNARGGLIFVGPFHPNHNPHKHKACTPWDTIRGPQSLGGWRAFASLCLNHLPQIPPPPSLPPAPSPRHTTLHTQSS